MWSFMHKLMHCHFVLNKDKLNCITMSHITAAVINDASAEFGQWMSVNRLRLNADKTEFLWTGSHCGFALRIQPSVSTSWNWCCCCHVCFIVAWCNSLYSRIWSSTEAPMSITIAAVQRTYWLRQLTIKESDVHSILVCENISPRLRDASGWLL